MPGGGRGTPWGAGWADVAIDHSFAGHALNAVDAKGRVSVPAAFRATLFDRLRANDVLVEDRSGGTLLIGPHPAGGKLVAYDQIGLTRLDDELRESVAELPAAKRREAFIAAQRAERGNLVSVPFDAAGRMVLPPVLRQIAGIAERAYFIGIGNFIEIWSPETALTAFADQPMTVLMLQSYLAGRPE